MKTYKEKSGKWVYITFILTCCFVHSIINNDAFGQCTPYIKVDGNMVNANSITSTGLSLPLWLTAGQALAADQVVQSISAIEFNVTTNALEFSQVKKITGVQTVPAGKVWKVESILKTTTLTNTTSAVFTGTGNYSLTLPACATYICIEVWGPGGGGAGGYYGNGGGGGGGGAYAQNCFSVTPGQTLTISIGSAGTGGNTTANGTDAGGPTSVTGTGVSISASGGLKGIANGGAAGAGGSTISGAAVAVAGGSGGTSGGVGGAAGGSSTNPGGIGGASGGIYAGTGAVPGGGGGAACCGNNPSSGGSGGAGRASISW